MPSEDKPQTQHLGAQELRELCSPPSACQHCKHLVCPGWESINTPLGEPLLQRVGTLRDPSVEDPTLLEHHPGGTGYWQPLAPIAPAWFPFNRSDLWRCRACHRGFLQYTEHGGYYVDHRVREVNLALVV